MISYYLMLKSLLKLTSKIHSQRITFIWKWSLHMCAIRQIKFNILKIFDVLLSGIRGGRSHMCTIHVFLKRSRSQMCAIRYFKIKWKKNDFVLLDVEVTFKVDFKNSLTTYYFHMKVVLAHVRHTPNKIQHIKYIWRITLGDKRGPLAHVHHTCIS